MGSEMCIRDSLDGVILELHDATALRADEVIVVIILEVRLVPRLPRIYEAVLQSDATLRHELHGPVDGGVAHRRILDLSICEELVEGPVPLAFAKEDLRDHATLAGVLQPAFAQEVSELANQFGVLCLRGAHDSRGLKAGDSR